MVSEEAAVYVASCIHASGLVFLNAAVTSANDSSNPSAV